MTRAKINLGPCKCGRGEVLKNRSICWRCQKEKFGAGPNKRPLRPLVPCARCGRMIRSAPGTYCAACREAVWQGRNPNGPRCAVCGVRISCDRARQGETLCPEHRPSRATGALRVGHSCPICSDLPHRRGEHRKDRGGICHWCEGSHSEEIVNQETCGVSLIETSTGGILGFHAPSATERMR